MPVTETDLVVQEVLISASPETIFGFLIDPDKMIRWMGKKAELDARPGGLFRVQVNNEATARGEYTVVVPNERVVFTWGWEEEGSPVRPGSTSVEITLVPEGDKTRVRLEHRDLIAQMLDPHDDGWGKYIVRLAAVAEGRDPGPDPYP